MKLFITWSGELSREVALAIRTNFPDVLVGLDVFMSEVDISSGVPWFETIAANLADSAYGIVVVTRENQRQPWLLFEAGALAIGLGKPRCTPLLVDLITSNDLIAPLNQLQFRDLGRDGLRKMLFEINRLREPAIQMGETQFDRIFDRVWKDLDPQFKAAKERNAAAAGAPAPPRRSVEDLTNEVLTEVRKLSRQFDMHLSELMRHNPMGVYGPPGAQGPSSAPGYYGPPGAQGPSDPRYYTYFDSRSGGIPGGPLGSTEGTGDARNRGPASTPPAQPGDTSTDGNPSEG